MTTEITTQTAGSGSLATLLVGSHLPLAAPTDITLTARNAQISGYQKSGADLSVRFADGNALQLQNFFVIGEQGDFSRLISASGAPLVTGLMGPEAESEPDEPQIAEAAIPSDAIEVFPNAALMSDAQSGAEVTGAATPAPSGDAAPAGNMSVGSVSADGDSGGSWSQPTLLAGLGIASGLSLSSGGTAPSAATTSAASAGGGIETSASNESGADDSGTHVAGPHDAAAETSGEDTAPDTAQESALLESMAADDSLYDIALIVAPEAQPTSAEASLTSEMSSPQTAAGALDSNTPDAGDASDYALLSYLAEILANGENLDADGVSQDASDAHLAPEDTAFALSASDAASADLFVTDAPSEQPFFPADLLSDLTPEADL